MSDDKLMSELDQIRYAAFKRGIGWIVVNALRARFGLAFAGNTRFHAAAIEYVRECREADERTRDAQRATVESLLRRLPGHCSSCGSMLDNSERCPSCAGQS